MVELYLAGLGIIGTLASAADLRGALDLVWNCEGECSALECPQQRLKLTVADRSWLAEP